MTKDSSAFSGISTEALELLREIGRRQDREWFRDHKADFERLVRDPLMRFAEAVSQELDRREVALMADPKRSLSRIYRDIRFSNNKDPFRDYLGLVLSRTGLKKEPGSVYLQVGGETAFVAAGYWCPPPALLRGLRDEIASRSDTFADVVGDLAEAKLTLSNEDMLTRPPRDFADETDPQLLDWLKRKSLFVERPLTTRAVTSRRLVKEVADFAEQAIPLLAFGWSVVDRLPQESTGR